MSSDWVPIELPDNFDEMFDAWAGSTEPNIGFCLLCSGHIFTEADLIPETNTHDCEAGRELDAKIRRAQLKPRCRENRDPRQNSQ